jgi:hypothetical protein
MKRPLFKLARFPILAACLLLIFGSVRCATVAPGNDPVLVKAEASQKAAFDGVRAFLTIEYENRAEFQSIAPDVTKIADEIRKKLKGDATTPGVFSKIDAAIDAYRNAKATAGDLSAADAQLKAAIAGGTSLLATADQYVAQWTAAKAKKTHSYLIPPIRGPGAGQLLLLGAVSFGTIVSWLLPVITLGVTALGGPGLGTLAGRAAATLLDAGSKIVDDAEQTSEMTPEAIAAWRKWRDDIIANAPEMQVSTDAAPPSPAPAPPDGSTFPGIPGNPNVGK